MKQTSELPDARLRRAVSHYNYKWPKSLPSGVMFYEGLRITVIEFNKYARNFANECQEQESMSPDIAFGPNW